jgi:hypothetical protein
MDFLAGGLELLGSWLLGNRSRLGFVCLFLACGGWIYVAFDRRVYGLLVVVLPALVINVRNYIKWGRGE